MKFSSTDEMYMERALQLAQLGGVAAAPNPMVGAVIVHDNRIIGEGFHQKFGEAHAEVNAVNSVKDKSKLSEATIYVTLEPCSHFGKTPPCADLIVQHRFKRVVVACLDSNSLVAGKGIEHIRNTGIDVSVGLLEKEALWLNRRFFTFQEKKRPYVVLKWAETRDGFIDRLPEKREEGINWITQPRMKLYVHKWRSKEQAIMVGWKTVNNDNPQLNVREIAGRSPHRFIIDPKGNINVDATVCTDGNPTTIISLQSTIKGLPNHVELVTLPAINTTSILKVLSEKNIISVFIEGGAATLKAFIDENNWDFAYQLIGQNTFGEGIEAPVLKSKLLLSNEDIEGDLILSYKHLKV